MGNALKDLSSNAFVTSAGQVGSSEQLLHLGALLIFLALVSCCFLIRFSHFERSQCSNLNLKFESNDPQLLRFVAKVLTFITFKVEEVFIVERSAQMVID